MASLRESSAATRLWPQVGFSKYHPYMVNGNPFPMDTKVTFALPNQTFAASLRRGWFL
jgi:hypothetical protein